MDFKWCDCDRRNSDATYTVPAFGDAIACSKCDGFLVCEICKQATSNPIQFPIALLAIGNKFVCPQHAWNAIALGNRQIQM